MMSESQHTPIEDEGPEAPDTWKWHRLRNIAFGVEFWPLEWGFGIDRNAGFYGGKTSLGLGPFVLTLHYNSCTGLFRRAELDVPV